ncbi:MAG TPA: prepilin-type N-terminal cleavage/methylation domain-containing protein, partial [Opitutaceae bacterium]
MILPDDESQKPVDGAPRKADPVGFTMIEMIVTLGVASLLMIAVVAFMVNGMVSATKTTSINDTTTKGRYIFEHLSKEMARAADLSVPNFTTPNATSSAYQGFTYRIAVGGAGTAATCLLSSQTVTVTIPAPAPPDNLVPQAGDFLMLPFPNLGPTGTQIAGVSFTGTSSAGYTYVLTLGDTLANLSGQPTSDSVPAYSIATIQRQRAYAIQNDATVPGTQDLWWYPATTNLPATMVVAKSLPSGQFPFVPQPKVPTPTGQPTNTPYTGTVYVGVQLALSVPSTEKVQVQAGQSGFYSNNTINAVFANKSGQSFSLVYLPTPTPSPTPTPTPSPCGRFARPRQSGWSASLPSTSSAPIRSQLSPSTIASPGRTALRRRSSTASMPSFV